MLGWPLQRHGQAVLTVGRWGQPSRHGKAGGFSHRDCCSHRECPGLGNPQAAGAWAEVW